MRSEDHTPFSLIGPFAPYDVVEECMRILNAIAPDMDFPFVRNAFHDVIDLFEGRQPGFKASNTSYHDLEHTLAVTLACVRFMHGAVILGEKLDGHNARLCLLAALFHDTGLIQRAEESTGTGARHTIGHEARSMEVARHFMGRYGMSEANIQDVCAIIESTILAMPVSEVQFRNDDVQLFGHILAASDILAQMADKAYLEKLPLLFQEFEEAGIPGYDSEIMLLEKTQGFYDFVAKKRIESLGDVSRYMRAHYFKDMGLDRDPYHEALIDNLDHLQDVLTACRENHDKRFEARGLVLE